MSPGVTPHIAQPRRPPVKTAANKFYVALGGFVTVFVAVIEDGHISPKEWGALLVAAYVAAGVWFVSNPDLPPKP